MSEYNLTITFMVEHIKDEYYAQVPHTKFKEEALGLLLFLPGGKTNFYPWTSIAKLKKEMLR